MGIHKRIKTSCPHCQQNIYKTIFWGFSTHLTLFGNRETLVVCSHCLYAYINLSLPFDKERLSCLLQSKNYQKLYASYKHRFEKKQRISGILLVQKIYKHLDIQGRFKHELLLYRYLEDYKPFHLKNFVSCVEKELYLYRRYNQDYFMTLTLIGEYYQQIGKQQKAKEIFKKITTKSSQYFYKKYYYHAHQQLKKIE